MEPETTIKDRVRENTSDEDNMKIDQKVKNRMTGYRSLTINEINERLEKVQSEWDIERALEMNAASLAITGTVLGLFGRKFWLVVPLVITGFLLQHVIQGWGPPATLLRRMGYRTRQEIDEEIFALKTLRGDFDALKSTTEPDEIMSAYRRL
ncbi:MAG TPA: hypothetical protein VK155_08295 [Bacteroidales bacterium]|nr:hypothetical protein [Bacteroidales bacterium]